MDTCSASAKRHLPRSHNVGTGGSTRGDGEDRRRDSPCSMEPLPRSLVGGLYVTHTTSFNRCKQSSEWSRTREPAALASVARSHMNALALFAHVSSSCCHAWGPLTHTHTHTNTHSHSHAPTNTRSPSCVVCTFLPPTIYIPCATQINFGNARLGLI
jgi:hypothetical protein